MAEKRKKDTPKKEEHAREVVITPSFKVIKSVLLYKEYHNRDEILWVSGEMLRIARESDMFNDYAVTVYKEAHEKLSALTYEQMCHLIKMLKTPIAQEGEDEV